MSEINFDEVWVPVQSVIELRRLDYEEAVTIGGSFGTLRAEIMRLQEQNKRFREVIGEAMNVITPNSYVFDLLEEVLESEPE